MDPIQHNQIKWDAIAKANDRWFKAVTSQELEAARQGDWRLNITAQKSVPQDWLDPLTGKAVLCLAGAGGKQAPILAALGAKVTVFDISQSQLNRDLAVAQKEGLVIEAIQGDMSDLSSFNNASFDVVFNPCSICYCPDPSPVWKEVYRVLKAGGNFISGLINPSNYLFDEVERDEGNLVVKHMIPYSDLDVPVSQRAELWGDDRPLDFGHSLDAMIGGLLKAGFQMTGFYEDRWGGEDVLSEHLDVFFAVKMSKPRS